MVKRFLSFSGTIVLERSTMLMVLSSTMIVHRDGALKHDDGAP
jgi:hypothetical protein